MPISNTFKGLINNSNNSNNKSIKLDSCVEEVETNIIIWPHYKRKDESRGNKLPKTPAERILQDATDNEDDIEIAKYCYDSHTSTRRIREGANLGGEEQTARYSDNVMSYTEIFRADPKEEN